MRAVRNGRNSPPNHAVNSTINHAANGTIVDQLEGTSHPFIVRIWLEETEEETGQAVWRGHITHVPSGERRYLKKLEDITAFITPYLERMGVKLGLLWRVRRWLD